jgi:K+-sensing histidine kinase KdpD
MVPLRSHLSVATTGLLLVIPVVAGSDVGGYTAGIVSVVAGFLVYDLMFTPPYYTLTVAKTQNWVALGVYVVVMLLVARVVAHLEEARTLAQRREADASRLFHLSEMLVEDRSVDELLKTIVGTVQSAFNVAGVALLLPSGDRLEVASWAGTPLSEAERRRWTRSQAFRCTCPAGPASRASWWRSRCRPRAVPWVRWRFAACPRRNPTKACYGLLLTTPPLPWSVCSCGLRPSARNCLRKWTG